MARTRRQVRRNKQIVEDPEYKPTKPPAYLIIQETVLGVLGGSSDGFTFKQLYQMMPNIDPRRVREAIQTLEAKKNIHHEKCRCGAASVYYKS
jgi:hypothetical protein